MENIRLVSRSHCWPSTGVVGAVSETTSAGDTPNADLIIPLFVALSISAVGVLGGRVDKTGVAGTSDMMLGGEEVPAQKKKVPVKHDYEQTQLDIRP
jgi:hypothetical protein